MTRSVDRRKFLCAGGAGLAAAAGLGLGLHWSRRGEDRAGLQRKRINAMGSWVELSAPAGSLAAALPLVAATLRDVETRMSSFEPESEICRLNAAGQAVLSPELADLLATCRRYHTVTDGAFDPTVGPLVEAWGFRGEPAQPARWLLRQAFERVGLGRLRLDGRQASFGAERMALDLGGIAVGHGIDRAAAALRRAGLQHGLINAAGDIRAVGSRPDGEAWTVGLQGPDEGKAPFATVRLPADRALTTSGTYRKFLDLGRRRVSHIFDPRTGDSPQEVVSATVLADSAVVSDALATACVVLGGGEALRLLERTPGAEGLLLLRRPGSSGHDVEATAGLRVRLLRAV